MHYINPINYIHHQENQFEIFIDLSSIYKWKSFRVLLYVLISLKNLNTYMKYYRNHFQAIFKAVEYH
jgi:hypothetical protein